jgi:hypothetical protein
MGIRFIVSFAVTFNPHLNFMTAENLGGKSKFPQTSRGVNRGIRYFSSLLKNSFGLPF